MRPHEPPESTDIETPAEPTEIEIKLGVERPGVVRALLRRPDPRRLAGFTTDTAPHLVLVTDRYLDTEAPAGRLFTAGIRARLRRRGNAVTLTVKRSGVDAGGYTTRAELEGPATRSLDPGRWPPSDARALLERTAEGRPIVEIAQLRQRRLTQHLRRGESLVEMSLDGLEALRGGRVVARRYEVEAELKRGDERHLSELADALLAIDGVGPPLGSKLAFAMESAARAGGTV